MMTVLFSAPQSHGKEQPWGGRLCRYGGQSFVTLLGRVRFLRPFKSLRPAWQTAGIPSGSFAPCSSKYTKGHSDEEVVWMATNRCGDKRSSESAGRSASSLDYATHLVTPANGFHAGGTFHSRIPDCGDCKKLLPFSTGYHSSPVLKCWSHTVLVIARAPLALESCIWL